MCKAHENKNISAAFNPEKIITKKEEIKTEQRFARIEELTLMGDFLKKVERMLLIEIQNALDFKIKMSRSKQFIRSDITQIVFIFYQKRRL